jgi:hypothetical protein
MTSSRLADLYVGDECVISGGGAAALAAQFIGGAGLIAGIMPSEASVDVDGVLGKVIIVARLGKGLSMSGIFAGGGNRIGRPVDDTDAFELSLESTLPAGTNAGGRPPLYIGPAPQTTTLVSRKIPGNFLVSYGSFTSSFSNGTPSRRMILLTSSGRSEHSSSIRA